MDIKLFVSVSAALAAIIAAVIAGCVAVWTARQSRKAAQKLAKQQADYTAQIETLKNQLAFSLARKSKFTEKEFEVLAECWKIIGQLRLAVIKIESHGVQFFRDCYVKDGILSQLAEFTEAECKENLKITKELSDEYREVIARREPEKRGLYFSYYILRFYRDKYLEKMIKFADYFSDNRIFLNLSIQSDFKNIYSACDAVNTQTDKLLKSSLDKEDIRLCLEDIDKELSALTKAMDDKFWQLERIVAERLFPEDTMCEKDQNNG